MMHYYHQPNDKMKNKNKSNFSHTGQACVKEFFSICDICDTSVLLLNFESRSFN